MDFHFELSFESLDSFLASSDDISSVEMAKMLETQPKNDEFSSHLVLPIDQEQYGDPTNRAFCVIA
ncbi:hypothetical protein CPB83DRAFT_858241 [Crepidotus variabilis]|uniref:Pheromone n=1 Tax=Crepidotus variabilis TaxID=179855 RepID=A0A9P6EBU3_9AGAR|nr:hypothetical protein CPB83DRAFT_858241 [Crepidotus variabilis]